jgi:hypothetical protein
MARARKSGLLGPLFPSLLSIGNLLAGHFEVTLGQTHFYCHSRNIAPS